MGIGDMIIFLPFIETISKNFNSPITLLVKESSKASEYLNKNKHVDKIISLRRSNNKSDYHDGFYGFYRLAKELKEYSFDKVFIFNSSLRYNLICKLAGIKQIYQYQLFKKNKQHIIGAAKNLLLSKLNLKVESYPKILLEEAEILKAKDKLQINNNQINILLGIGGSGPTKRIPANKFIKFIELCLNQYDCKFFLATGKNEEEQKILKQIIYVYKKNCISLDNLSISETLPIIKNCKISICNDSCFSHLSAGLGLPTIVLMCDTPLLYGNYSPNMHPILPDDVKYVTHGTNGKEKINPEKIFEKFKSIIIN
jgi:heptosyltransferase-2